MKFPSWRHRQRGDDLKNEIESHLEMAARDRAERAFQDASAASFCAGLPPGSRQSPAS